MSCFEEQCNTCGEEVQVQGDETVKECPHGICEGCPYTADSEEEIQELEFSQ